MGHGIPSRVRRRHGENKDNNHKGAQHHDRHDLHPQVDATTIRQAIRDRRIDHIADLVQDNRGIRDAVILTIIDPTVTDLEFARLVNVTRSPKSLDIMNARLTKAFTSQGVADPQDARRYADQLAVNGHAPGYANLLAAAGYIHWACGDIHADNRLAHDALDLEPTCSLAAIVTGVLRHDIQWATSQ